MSEKYFEYDDDEGDYIPVAGEGLDDSTGMRTVWQTSEVSAGSLKRSFGALPSSFTPDYLPSQSHTEQEFREIYWRQYVRTVAPFNEDPWKLSRAVVFAEVDVPPNGRWTLAAAAFVWGDGDNQTIDVEGGSGTDEDGNMVATGYDITRYFTGELEIVTPAVWSTANNETWFCIETRAKLNDDGLSNGILQAWVDDVLKVDETGLNWVGVANTYTDTAWNTIMFEGYWNSGAPGTRTRYIDNIVISAERIGCSPTIPTPTPTTSPSPTASPTNPPPTATPTADPSEPTGVLGYNWRMFR
jgi:hypothetical protein